MRLSNFLYINSLLNGTNFSASEFDEIIENRISDKRKLKLVKRSKLEILEALNQCVASDIACNMLGAFSVDKIRELHYALYKNIDNATAGRLRSYSKYGTTDVSAITTELSDFCDKLNTRTIADSIAETLAIINFDFIKISPFSNGNKQIARFLCLPFLTEQNDFIEPSDVQDYIWVCKNPTYNGFLKLFQTLEENSNSSIQSHRDSYSDFDLDETDKSAEYATETISISEKPDLDQTENDPRLGEVDNTNEPAEYATETISISEKPDLDQTENDPRPGEVDEIDGYKTASIIETDKPNIAAESVSVIESEKANIVSAKAKRVPSKKIMFLPKKSPRQLLRIGAAAACANVPITSFRYWFNCGLIDAIITDTNQALFSKKAIAQVKKILELQQKGYSIRDIKDLIKNNKK